MKRPRKNSQLWQYLKDTGVLDKGEDEIKAAKTRFRKEYLKQYKQGYKGTHWHYNIAFTHKERSIIIRSATEAELRTSSFIKQAALTFCKESFIVPHPSLLHAILQKLLHYEIAISRIAEKDKEAWYKPDRRYSELEVIIKTIKADVEMLYNKPLEKTIQEKLMQQPDFYTTLQTILVKYDSQKFRP